MSLTPSTEKLFSDLRKLCGMPGSLGQPELLGVVASRVAGMLQQRGMSTSLLPTTGAPIVIGRRSGRSPFTLLLYHHYDVAPAGPWRAWNHEPFQVAERDNVWYARGVAAGKGPLVAHLAAIDALLEAEGELPCGVVFVVEGEGLSGSPNLGPLLLNTPELLQADACLSSGGELDASGVPISYGGAKGLLQVRLTAVGANQPLPPGMAASVANPLWRLIWALGQIKSDQEEILIDGFYNDVDGPNRSENQLMRSVQLNEEGRLAAWGLGQFLFGMNATTLTRTESTLPTCNVSNLMVEPRDDLQAIPVVASAQVDFHLVPNQRPQVIVELLQTHLAAKDASDIAVERLSGGYPAHHTPVEHPFAQQVRDVGQQVFGAALPWVPIGYFAKPLYVLHEALNIPSIVLGCALPDSSTYGANEHIPSETLLRHGMLLIDLLRRLVSEPVGRIEV